MIGTADGVVKAYSCKRRPEDERWDIEAIDRVQGVPHQPNPRKIGLQIPIRVDIPDEQGPPAPVEPTMQR